MGFIGKLIKRGATDVDDDDDDLDLEEDEAESVDTESDAGVSKGGLLGRLRSLRKRKGSDDDDDWDPEGLLEKDKVSDDGSGPEPGAEPEEDDSPPDVQVVRLEGVPDVHPVGDSGGNPMAPGPQPGNAPSATGGQGGAGGGNGASSTESSPAEGEASAGQPTENQDKSNGDAKGGNEGSGLSLKDIFEDEVQVNEVLKELAANMEDIPVQELADDLKEFFEELEASMQ